MNLQSIPFIRSPRFSDAALLILMLGILSVAFWPVISSPDKAISKLNMLASIDSWQNLGWKYPALYTGDCSSVVTHVPNEVFALSSQASGEVPLWNNLSACGRPFFAEFQTLAWSTYRKLFPASSAHAYELGLLFKLAASGVGMFLVARMIGFGSIAAFAAGTAFMFCPRCLNVLDLCGNYFFYPWVVLLFLWMSRRPCLLVTTLVGITCGAIAYEMHPETFAFAILLGFVFSLSETRNERSRQDAGAPGIGPSIKIEPSILEPRILEPRSILSVRRWFVCVLGASAITFAIAAPLFLGLFEFICNGASYKFIGLDSAYLGLPELFADLILPVSGFRAYVGPVLGASLLVGFFAFFRYRFVLAITYFVSILLACRPAFFKDLCDLSPLVWIGPEYFLSVFLFLHCLLCALGLELLFSKKINQKNAFFAVLLVLVPSLVCVQTIEHHPLAIHVSNAFVSGVFVLLGILIFALAYFRNQFVLLGLVFANLWLLASLIPTELPIHEVFRYRNLPAYLQPVKSPAARMIATGNTFFHPHTNIIYGISDLRSLYPIHPKRVFEFVKLCGIQMKFGPMQYAPSQLNRFYDLASVDYVLTDAGIEDLNSTNSGEANSQAYQFLQNKSIEGMELVPGLILGGALIDYDPVENNINVTLKLKSAPKYIYYSPKFFVTDPSNRAVTSSKWIPGEYAEKIDDATFSIRKALPLGRFKIGDAFRIFLALSPNAHEEPFHLKGSYQTPFGPGLLLGEIRIQNDSIASNSVPRFSLRETGSDGFRLYKNNSALKRAYVVHDFHIVGSPEESRQSIQDPKFDPRKRVILESNSVELPKKVLAQNQRQVDETDSVRILDDASDSILLQCRTVEPGLLVLTDTFYPGWNAWVNGNQVEIMPANLAFRAVAVPAGESFVLMRFEPMTFKTGVQIMVAGSMLALLLLLIGFVQLKPQIQRRGTQS
ncbi:MAG: YfhO family protein [Candidatus Obscuribacterales bacterium]|jgi:hypothetical protein|nr:YfhO family protein [Candidatus Obscuribacterales bacterium]